MLVHKDSTFFDVRVFNPTALSYCSTAVSSLYRQFDCTGSLSVRSRECMNNM